jgi:hypothetical protein
MGIIRKRVRTLAQEQAGLKQLRDFLDEIDQHMIAIAEAIARMNALLGKKKNLIRDVPATYKVIDWFREHADDDERLAEWAADALRRAKQQKRIASDCVVSGRTRKLSVERRAALDRLERTRENLEYFLTVVAPMAVYIRDDVRMLLALAKCGRSVSTVSDRYPP